ncbi:MAG: hypothetical protein V1855_04615, partial [bacterium]
MKKNSACLVVMLSLFPVANAAKKIVPSVPSAKKKPVMPSREGRKKRALVKQEVKAMWIDRIKKNMSMFNENLQNTTIINLITVTTRCVQDSSLHLFFPLVLAEWYRRVTQIDPMTKETLSLDLNPQQLAVLTLAFEKAEKQKALLLTNPLKKPEIQDEILKSYTEETAASLQKNLPIVFTNLKTQLKNLAKKEDLSPLAKATKGLIQSLEQFCHTAGQLSNTLQAV